MLPDEMIPAFFHLALVDLLETMLCPVAEVYAFFVQIFIRDRFIFFFAKDAVLDWSEYHALIHKPLERFELKIYTRDCKGPCSGSG